MAIDLRLAIQLRRQLVAVPIRRLGSLQHLQLVMHVVCNLLIDFRLLLHQRFIHEDRVAATLLAKGDVVVSVTLGGFAPVAAAADGAASGRAAEVVALP